MADDDPFRYCIYCNADCYESEPEHAADCPSVTDVFPFTEKDTLCRCGRPLPDDQRMVCMDCKATFEPGDHYTHRWVGEADMGFGSHPVGEVICLGCAALAEIT